MLLLADIKNILKHVLMYLSATKQVRIIYYVDYIYCICLFIDRFSMTTKIKDVGSNTRGSCPSSWLLVLCALLVDEFQAQYIPHMMS